MKSMKAALLLGEAVKDIGCLVVAGTAMRFLSRSARRQFVGALAKNEVEAMMARQPEVAAFVGLMTDIKSAVERGMAEQPTADDEPSAPPEPTQYRSPSEVRTPDHYPGRGGW